MDVRLPDDDAVSLRTRKAALPLYATRIKVYPRAVTGPVRRVKWLALVLLLGIYYLVPWLRWDRGPGAPDQAILIDLDGRRGWFFDVVIWPQEIYFVTGLLILAAIGLFFATALFGRVWCGFACPQTVWTDLFMLVERLIEGDRNERMRLDRTPMSAAQGPAQGRQARGLARHRRRHRRRLDLLLRRRAQRRCARSSRRGLARSLFLHRPAHGHDLPAGRLGARAGLHLHVPVAALPGGDARRAERHRHLPEMARRAARQAQGGRQLVGPRRLRRLQACASPSARPASTSATASRSNASAAASASTPATRRWTRSAARAA